MAAATGSRPQPVATTLPPLEAQYVAAVFEHCLDQLEVLGNIVPSFLDMHIQDRRDSVSCFASTCYLVVVVATSLFN